ncbi:MAG TPA: ATP-binding protein [Melioribacteraceae bacterium]|nr:ATP-binding protein [Melioribacteraceae bacterium]
MPDSKLCSRENLVEILDSLNVGVVYVDKERRFSFINKAGEEIRNIKSEDRIGSSVLDCHAPQMQNRVLEDLSSFKKGEYLSRHKMIHVKGKYFENTYSVVKDANGEFKGVVLISKDVTEKEKLAKELKKTNEELELKVIERTAEIEQAYNKLKIAQQQLMQTEKMSAIGQFVSGVAHEINNPLDGIQNCIRMVLSDVDDRRQTQNYLSLALEGLFKIEILVKQLLDYAKPHSFEKQELSIKQILDESLQFCIYKLKENNISLDLKISDDLKNIYGDLHYLNQVFVNLILNACDAMSPGGKLSICVSNTENESISVKIKDTGIGIPKEQINKIFDPFFTTKQKDKGTGLGLYLSYNVLNEHRAKVFVKSKVKKGTEFTIIFPNVECREVETKIFSETVNMSY